MTPWGCSHPCITIVTTTATALILDPPEPPLVLYCPSSVPILVAGLRSYCVRPPMGYLDLGPSVSGPGGRPLAIHVTHTEAITAVKPLIDSLSHADRGEAAGRPS